MPDGAQARLVLGEMTAVMRISTGAVEKVIAIELAHLIGSATPFDFVTVFVVRL